MRKSTINDGSLSIGDIFLEKCKPKNESFTLTVNGIAIKCRVITDYSELQKMRREASEFAGICIAGKLSKELKPWAPSDPETAARAFYLTKFAVEPKVTQLDALKIAKGCGLAFDQIVQAIDQTCLIETTLTFNEAIESEKKDSSETPLD